MKHIDLIDVFGSYSKDDSITVLDVIKDFAETCGVKAPIKGGLALSYLYDTAQPSARNTIDIDYHFRSMESWEAFKECGMDLATRNSRLGVTYKLIGCKQNPNGESLKIEFHSEHLSGKFSIDMNLGGYCTTVLLRNVTLYSPEMILADKISVLCSEKIQRRCKDIYDIYLIANNENFDLIELCEQIEQKLESRGIILGELSLLKPRILKNIETGYRKLKLIDMPNFEDVCKVNLNFLLPIIAFIRTKKCKAIYWSKEVLSWNTNRIYGEAISTDLEGIICKETASGMLHLSTFPPFPVLVYNEYLNLNMGIVRFIKNENKENIQQLREGLYITDEERTIVDMIDDGEYRMLMESIATYREENEEDLSKLRYYASIRGQVRNLELLLKEESEN